MMLTKHGLGGCIALFAVSVAILVMHTKTCALGDAYDDGRTLIIRRLHVAVQVLRCLHHCYRLADLKYSFKHHMRKIKSHNRRRFVDLDKNFDLDLTYICDRMLVMSLPCVYRAFYKNDIREVSRFFSTYHYGHFSVFNLCEEFEAGGHGCYDTNLLFGQVKKMRVTNDHPPYLHTMVNFCMLATEFLNQSTDNALAIHCWTGKTRSGLLAVALMLWTGLPPVI